MVLEVISVYFLRNKRLIFDNFNLKLAKSQIIILIGNNGVGKTSLFDLIVGILKPKKGLIKINKTPVNEIDRDKRKIFTYLPHKDSLKDYLTVEENLINWLDITNNQLNHDDFSKSLEYFNLHEISQDLMGNLSHGQRKKVSLTKLLLTNSELWILDEPFNGLDIESTEKTKTMIEDHKKKGGSIILASHINLNIKGSKKIFIKNPYKKLKKISNFNSWEDI